MAKSRRFRNRRKLWLGTDVLVAIIVVFVIAAQVLRHHRSESRQLAETRSGKPVTWFKLPHTMPNRRLQFDSTGLSAEQIQKQLADVKTPGERADLLEELATNLAIEPSSVPAAIESLQNARSAIAKTDPDRALEFLSLQGILSMKLAELRNCTAHHNSESCVFPLSVRAQHTDRRSAEQAIRYFLEYLEKKPDDLHIRWLLLLANMALGQFPEGVPKKYRLAVPEPEATIPRFRDYAKEAGLLDRSLQGGGASINDFRNTGCMDLVLSSNGKTQGMRYLESDCKGGFVDRSVESGLAAEKDAVNLSVVDFNNDGLLDIYLERGGWRGVGGYPVKNSLLMNLGNGKFKNVTAEVGLDSGPNTNVTAAWCDFNNDGKLDVVVCDEQTPAKLFFNEGDHFVDVTEKSGFSNAGYCKGVACGDINNDGNMDIFVANNSREASQIFMNRGDGTFEKKDMPGFSVWDSAFDFATFFFDYDNDGWDDLFIAKLAPFFQDALIDFLGLSQPKEHPAPLRLFHNDHGVLRDVSKETGINRTMQVMGLSFGDLKGDGYPDIYLGTGDRNYGSLLPNRVLLNMGGKRFADATLSTGAGTLQKGHGISFGDVDGDGHLDVLQSLGGFYEADKFFPKLLINPGNSNHWVRLLLKGTKSNWYGIGSKLHFEVIEAGKPRDIYFTVGGTGSYGQNSVVPLVGLGQATRISRLEIRWAGSKTRQEFTNLGLDQTFRLVEGQDQLIPTPYPSFKLHH